MNKGMRVVIAAALAVASAEPVAAQLGDMGGGRRMVRIGFGGGVSVPTDNAGDALEKGINGQAFVLFDTGFLPPLRFNLGYQKFDIEEAVLGAARGGDTSVLSGVAGLTIPLISLGPIQPYVTGGLGAFNIKQDLDTTGGDTSSSTTEFGIDGGAGIALRLGRLEGFIEARLQNVYTDQGFIDTETIKLIPVSFGIIF